MIVGRCLFVPSWSCLWVVKSEHRKWRNRGRVEVSLSPGRDEVRLPQDPRFGGVDVGTFLTMNSFGEICFVTRTPKSRRFLFDVSFSMEDSSMEDRSRYRLNNYFVDFTMGIVHNIHYSSFGQDIHKSPDHNTTHQSPTSVLFGPVYSFVRGTPTTLTFRHSYLPLSLVFLG